VEPIKTTVKKAWASSNIYPHSGVLLLLGEGGLEELLLVHFSHGIPEHTGLNENSFSRFAKKQKMRILRSCAE
jgi:hypothetical protein